MEIPGLGEVSKDDRFGWYYSDEIPIPVLGGRLCRVVVKDYDDDASKSDFHEAIANFLKASPEVLRAATRFVHQYCQDMNANWAPDDPEYVHVAIPEDVWKHVKLGREPMVRRRSYGDNKMVYVSVECECDWEPEHGLQIVFKKGQVVNKIGPYDGHLTNSDAFADDALENITYRSEYQIFRARVMSFAGGISDFGQPLRMAAPGPIPDVLRARDRSNAMCPLSLRIGAMQPAPIRRGVRESA